ncbi:methyltransferase domain-containing protein [Denitromonas iodatirespirans]|uniref:Methyltransferase domain-containing protein n=1 Tax=Denitromonas iodatirespirans TaxID=2795389 RepID=A0A944DBG4_DENI1|nr:methyltransferase domain-containing protein [Denitromonas iodatirespirans]MBT0962322.1 methyltransferase domain-containing protein [Denitromonas iodatirespirans]
MQDESVLMRQLRRFGFESKAWAMRRFHCPVNPDALVLEVGSGGNPYPRANVLLDAYETTRERHWAPLSADRPTVLGFVENLPFRDQVFDFVIAAHVLEHSTQPEQFLSELQRVARAGYIEVPDAFLERVNPYRDHRLEITCRDNTLLIWKKPSWRPEKDIVELYEDRVKSVMTRSLVPRHPFEFHVRYYWENKIAYRVINPEVDAAWAPPESAPHGGVAGGVRAQVRDFLRWGLSQRRRNASIVLDPLLRCPTCLGESLTRSSELIVCAQCNTVYPVRRGIPVMNEGAAA